MQRRIPANHRRPPSHQATRLVIGTVAAAAVSPRGEQVTPMWMHPVHPPIRPAITDAKGNGYLFAPSRWGIFLLTRRS